LEASKPEANRKDPEEDAITKLGVVIAEDIEALVKQRKCHTNDAFKAVFKEVLNKVNKARELEPKIPDWVFSLSVKAYWPKLYEFLVRDGVFPALPNNRKEQ
jgi:hypothetical protein